MKPRRQYSLKEDLTTAVESIFFVLWFTTPIWIIILLYLPPKFSLHVVDATATGLDDAKSTPPPPPPTTTISTVFNMTLHAANRRPMARCYGNGEAAVRYSGHTVAWGRTTAFCVGAGEARDVPVVAWADGGVSLPPAVRERMAADWRRADGGGGAVELDVDVKLFRADDGSATPAWVSCKVTAGGGGGGAKPPAAVVTPCTTFALENWASDISDHLLALKSLVIG